jgi:hypothetical protein
MALSACCGVRIGISQEVQMCWWANFYQGLANEAEARAARASNRSLRDKLEAAAKEWAMLAVWAEVRAN